MTVLIRDIKTSAYMGKLRGWTHEHAHAVRFDSIGAAFSVALAFGDRDLELIVDFFDGLQPVHLKLRDYLTDEERQPPPWVT